MSYEGSLYPGEFGDARLTVQDALQLFENTMRSRYLPHHAYLELETRARSIHRVVLGDFDFLRVVRKGGGLELHLDAATTQLSHLRSGQDLGILNVPADQFTAERRIILPGRHLFPGLSLFRSLEYDGVQLRYAADGEGNFRRFTDALRSVLRERSQNQYF